MPRGVTTPRAPPRRAKDLADVERSFWDMGSAEPQDAEPSGRDIGAGAGRIASEPLIGSAAGVEPPPASDAGLQAELPTFADRDAEHRAEGAESSFLQPDHDLPQTGPRQIHVVRPETWRRVAAWAVDAGPFVAGAIWLARTLVRQAGRSAPVEGLDGFLDLVAREQVIVISVTVVAGLALAVYATLAHALAGATLGKKLFGLRLVGADGERPTMARSAVRSALGIVSALLLGLGFLLALFTRSGRALHDFLARTWVVRAP